MKIIFECYTYRKHVTSTSSNKLSVVFTKDSSLNVYLYREAETYAKDQINSNSQFEN